MPPRKGVPSLYELSFSATRNLVNVTCKTIEAGFPSPLDLDNDTGGYKQAVQEMHCHLRRYIPPVIWESLFHAVAELQHKTQMFHERILFSTFIYKDINLKKLKIGYKRTKNFDVESVTNCELFKLWLLKHLQLLTNLVEVDFSDTQLDIIPALCRNCVNMEEVTLPSDMPVEIMEYVICYCRKLRKISTTKNDAFRMIYNRDDNLYIRALNTLVRLEYTDWNIEANCLTELNPYRKLKLKSLILRNISIESLEFALNLCPNLAELSISEDVDSPVGDVFEILAASDVKLSKLTLKDFDIQTDTAKDFFTRKGGFLLDLEINKCISEENDILEALQDISAKCQRLTKLTVTNDIDGEPVESLKLTHNVTFRKLEHLVITDHSLGDIGIVAAHHCLSNAPELTSFSLNIINYDVDDIFEDEYVIRFDRILIELFSNERVKQFKSVQIRRPILEVSLPLIQHIYRSCSEMTSLRIGELSRPEELNLQLVVGDTKACNLDFTYIVDVFDIQSIVNGLNFQGII